MKNLFPQVAVITFLFLIVPAKFISAQTEFGVKGGALYSTYRTNYSGITLDFETQSGFLFGVYARKENLLGPIGLQAELLYQRKGAIEKTNGYPNYGYSPYGYGGYGGFGYSPYGYGYGQYPNYSYNYVSEGSMNWVKTNKHLHYFSLPVLFTYSPMKFLDVYCGPEFGYMFAESDNRIVLGEYNRFSAGIDAGFMAKLGEHTKLDFRYATDFTKVADMGSVEPKNQSFSVSVQQTLFPKRNSK